MQIAVKTLDGGDAGQIELNDGVFGLEARTDILHRVVNWQLANRRAPARAAQERSDVARTGKKFGRQKGGGTARHGNRAAPQFIGGGKAHGPRARTFDQSLNKKIRALGLKTALSVKVAEGKLIVVDTLALGEAKTRALKERLGRLGVVSGLFIDGAAVDGNFKLAAQNLYKVDVLPAGGANVYDILNHDTLVLSRGAVDALTERLAKTGGEFSHVAADIVEFVPDSHHAEAAPGTSDEAIERASEQGMGLAAEGAPASEGSAAEAAAEHPDAVIDPVQIEAAAAPVTENNDG